MSTWPRFTTQAVNDTRRPHRAPYSIKNLVDQKCGAAIVVPVAMASSPQTLSSRVECQCSINSGMSKGREIKIKCLPCPLHDALPSFIMNDVVWLTIVIKLRQAAIEQPLAGRRGVNTMHK